MLRLCTCLVLGTALLAQSPELGRVQRTGNQATLLVDSPRPLDSAAMTIADQFGIPVSAEDPAYLYRDDVKEITVEAASMPVTGRRMVVPKGGRLEVQFRLRADGSPENIRTLLQLLVDKANAQFPFAYRLDAQGDRFTLVPTRTRDSLGHAIRVVPLMDRLVTIPRGTRSIVENAKLMTADLSTQTGLRVSCCQAGVAGIPWGMEKVIFEAKNEAARSVLSRLIALSLQGRPNGYYWLQRCDPQPSGWCFINLQHIPARIESGERESQALPPAGGTSNPTGDRSRWFDPASPKSPYKK